MSNLLIRCLGRTIARWRLAHDGMRRLERLDDRLLADIGITRSQIYSASRRGRER
jgi:uncharacterized protein YjiS (DUF1127 family)